MVRSELMEQIPHLAMFCSENKEYFPNTIQDIVLPTVVRYLTDANNQVSHNTLPISVNLGRREKGEVKTFLDWFSGAIGCLTGDMFSSLKEMKY